MTLKSLKLDIIHFAQQQVFQPDLNSHWHFLQKSNSHSFLSFEYNFANNNNHATICVEYNSTQWWYFLAFLLKRHNNNWMFPVRRVSLPNYSRVLNCRALIRNMQKNEFLLFTLFFHPSSSPISREASFDATLWHVSN